MDSKLQEGIGLFGKLVVSIVAVLVIAVPIAVYYVKTERRLDSLEAQVSTMSTGIAIGNALSNPAVGTQNSGSTINPLWARCDDLADRTAKAIEANRTLTIAKSLQDLMRDLKCDGSGQ